MSRNICSLCLLLWLAACTRPVTPPVASRPASTLSEKTRLHPDSLRLIVPFVQQFIDSAYIAGAVVMVSRNNQVVYEKAIGYADRKKTRPLQTNDIFRIASMTKPIITVAAMQLVEQGKLALNDPVSKYIPSFRNPQVIENFNKQDSSYTTRPAKGEIMVHHLLTQTSGLGYGVFHPVAGPVYAPFRIIEAWNKDSISLAMNVPKIGKLPLLHHPGEQFTYGINTEVLAYLVEMVSGQPLDQYLHEHIFRLLGMEDTYFYLPVEKEGRLVEVWYRGERTAASFPESFRDDYPVSGHRMYFSGGGGLVSSASDYLNFANALLNKGSLNGVRVLKSETVEQMRRNQIGGLYLEKDVVQFGYGAALYTADGAFGRKKDRYSWGGFWQTTFWIDPARNLAAVVMSNAFDTPRSDPFFNGLEAIINHSVPDKTP